MVIVPWNSSIPAASASSSSLPVICEVVFVLGAPGTGKGTQCQLLQERLLSKEDGSEQHQLWTHLSAGDLLREERKSGGSELGELINSKISAGELVPSSITVKLLENAIIKSNQETHCSKFLIDGFPRGQENMQAWESTMKHHTIKFVLNFECPEEVLVGRLLERGKDSGRVDDNMEVIRKRFKTHQENTVPILTYFGKQHIPLHTIDSAKMVEHVYNSVEPLFL
ncbi:ADK-domain-containing protein [Fragilariopsis cylindrus CCMP1102]|uniref:ADK-domain-containing protein n=1 Tax=Fragilariopsis cylindrus CCMP1102 TaxID=635003 RepID=A0A1E7FJM2_9STRA|nr:ADK-domain-containing protein [Fragilariopsis cylindrus CCMP1102]|eukprot:OEU18347.1 ADK-domain-containing protein [Fragilariopsis cylindrus CCMP1102]